jgi:hypothetical protein
VARQGPSVVACRASDQVSHRCSESGADRDEQSDGQSGWLQDREVDPVGVNQHCPTDHP